MANRIEVFGDECKVEDCPYEHAEGSDYCSFHAASGEFPIDPREDEEEAFDRAAARNPQPCTCD